MPYCGFLLYIEPTVTQPQQTTSFPLVKLSQQLDGELVWDELHRIGYATDASAYRELPLAVAFPKHTADIQVLIRFARTHGVGLIPRTAGTSLAGQVVGNGIVVDVSRSFTQILEVNQEEQWVRVQPGVIRDELNQHLRPYGLLYGPETSTSNRAMIGGMVGNNSCGSNSVMYGSARDHLVEVTTLLADGTEVVFGELDEAGYRDKVAGKTTASELEQAIYKQVDELLQPEEHRTHIRERSPHPDIPRRNHGYALDLLMQSAVFGEGDAPFTFGHLLAGSEGTLAFLTEIKLNLVPLPPPVQGLVCVHFNDLYQALESTLVALNYNPGAVELMDHYILDCTKASLKHRANRFFLEGEPKALLVIQLLGEDLASVQEQSDLLIQDLKDRGYGYHYPLLTGDDCKRVWDLRKAGLGLLSNIPGDAKAVPVIEDTAVAVRDLPTYIQALNKRLDTLGLSCVHYAHAGSGELHLRPIIDLKTAEGQELFRTVLQETAEVVKEFRGALSGEHGDGRLRGEMIPYMVGERVYDWFREVKHTWDPHGIFNPGKIVDTPPMNESLRYPAGSPTREVDTLFRFDRFEGYQRTAELCNGSGDCRKTELTGGTMCPSYMATRDEMETTRARANTIREVFTYVDTDNPFDSEEIREVLKHCVSCKGCKSECPSNVDMARLKTEFEHQYQRVHGIPFRTRIIGHFSDLMKWLTPVAGIYNAVNQNNFTSKLVKQFMGFSNERSMPLLHRQTLRSWFKKHQPAPAKPKGAVYLFADEFTNYSDVEVGKATVLLLTRLGYRVELIDHPESGRAFFSKGMLDAAKRCAEGNVRAFASRVHAGQPLIGMEPSAILGFRDEYPDLVDASLADDARKLADHCLLLDEFLSAEMDAGRIDASAFTQEERQVLIHGHCHQKTLSNVAHTRKILSLPSGYTARLIPSGCCGMAGSFGYYEDYYSISMDMAELVLFPAVRKSDDTTLLAAPGTSCRHQIWDGTQRKALHPAQVLYEALA